MTLFLLFALAENHIGRYSAIAAVTLAIAATVAGGFALPLVAPLYATKLDLAPSESRGVWLPFLRACFLLVLWLAIIALTGLLTLKLFNAATS